MIRVLLSSQVRLYREALAESLSREDDLVVVGVVGGRGDTLVALRELLPEIVVIDLDHGGQIDGIRELANVGESKLIGLVATHEERDVVAYAEAGLAGFVDYDDSARALIETIRAAARGEFECSPSTAGALLRHVARLAAGRPTGSPQRPSLTEREIEVVLLLDEGLSNKQIAARLHIEVATVKHHVHHILEKLDAKRRSQAVAYARRAGLLEHD
ncbi:MAG: LuxR C-terminal-related transcriptional regulator [Gaiellaceae bacterium]